MPLAIHSFSKEEVMAFLDGELSGDRAVAVAQHLEVCEECQEHVSEFQGLARQLADWQIEGNDLEAPSPAIEQPPVKRHFWRRPALAIGALAVIVPVGLLMEHQNRVMPHFLPQARIASIGESPVFQGDRLQSSDLDAAAPSIAGPLVVRTAQLALISNNFGQIRSAVEQITKAHQGYIGQLQLNTPAGESRSLSASLRIPAAQLDSALAELKHLGRVINESQSGDDVTQRYVDLDARLTNLRTTEQRLQQMLKERTGRLSDILEVEQAVDKTRGEIDIAVAEQKSLSNQIAFARLQLNVSEQYRARLEGNDTSTVTRLWNAAVQGYRTACDSVIGTLAFLLAVGPTLLMVAVVGFFPALWIWRKRAYFLRNS